MNARAASFQMGRDRVQRAGTSLTIISTVDMPEWEVREFRRVAVWFGGTRYELSGRSRGGAGRIHYRLDPWPDDPTERPGAEVFYDRDYVAQRDRLLEVRRRLGVAGALLLPVHPLLGFLWYPTKERLQLTLGVEPDRVTRWSLFLEYLVLLVLGALNIIARHAPLGLTDGLLVVFILVLVPDAIMRWSLGHDGFPAGFYEWLVRRRRP